MKDPAQAVKDILVAEGIGNFLTAAPQPPTGWRTAIGRMPDAPDTIVLINSPGGRNPFPHLLYNEPSVSIIVRGAKGGYEAARLKAAAVAAALLGMESTTVLGDMYRSCNQMGDVAYLGQDDTTRPQFALNFWFTVLPAAEAGENRVPIT